MVTVQETKNYDLFVLHVFNREVKKVKKLEASMRKHGWLDPEPMHVIRQNGHLIIKNGHHRFEVARKLGIPVKYVVSKDTATMQELDGSGVPWSIQDHLGAFVRQGFLPYIILKEYHERTGIRISSCMSMLSGETAGSNNKTEAFKSGKFTITDTEHAEQVASCVKILKDNGVQFSTQDFLVQALSRVMWVVSLPRLKNKLKKHYSRLKRQPNVRAYCENLEEIYNCGDSRKLPVVFLQEQAARDRQKVWEKKRK